MAFAAIAANLKAQSVLATASRMRVHREDLRGQIGYIRNIRKFRAFYDSRYIGGAKACERGAISRFRELWANYRAFNHYTREVA